MTAPERPGPERGPVTPPEWDDEPDDEVEPERCPGCDSPLDLGCPRDCPELALDDDAAAWADRG